MEAAFIIGFLLFLWPMFRAVPPAWMVFCNSIAKGAPGTAYKAEMEQDCAATLDVPTSIGARLIIGRILRPMGCHGTLEPRRRRDHLQISVLPLYLC